MGRNLVIVLGAALIAAGAALAAWRWMQSHGDAPASNDHAAHAEAPAKRGTPEPEPEAVEEAPVAKVPVGPPALIMLGDQLHVKNGCSVCHKTDGTKGLGPSYTGQWGTTVALADGSSVLYDEAYVRESILNASAKRNAAYPGIMASYEGKLSDRELVALTLWIKAQTDSTRDAAYAQAEAASGN